MKGLITITAIFATASLMLACGGKAETKQNETKLAPVTPTVATATATANKTSVSTDGDRDDLKSPAANSANSANAKIADRDDAKTDGKTANTKQPKRTGDADDRGKKDYDGDDDDR